MGREVDGDSARANQFSETGRRRPEVSELLSVGRAICAAVAAVLYGLVWVAYEEFYGSLGLTPTEVGLGQATIVSRVAVFFGVLAFGFVACAGFGVVAYRLTAPVRVRYHQSNLPFDQWLSVTGRDVLGSWARVLVYTWVPWLSAWWFL